MTPKLYLYAGMLLAVLVALGALCAWGYGKGKASQLAADSAVIARKDTALHVASDALASAATALRAVSAQTQANARAAADAQARAAAAGAMAERTRQQLSAEQAAWSRKYAAARAQPDCRAVLEMHLCPAVSE